MRFAPIYTQRIQFSVMSAAPWGKAVAMRILHDGCFCHLEVVTESGNIQNSGEKKGGSGGAHCDDDKA